MRRTSSFWDARRASPRVLCRIRVSTDRRVGVPRRLEPGGLELGRDGQPRTLCLRNLRRPAFGGPLSAYLGLGKVRRLFSVGQPRVGADSPRLTEPRPVVRLQRFGGEQSARRSLEALRGDMSSLHAVSANSTREIPEYRVPTAEVGSRYLACRLAAHRSVAGILDSQRLRHSSGSWVPDRAWAQRTGSSSVPWPSSSVANGSSPASREVSTAQAARSDSTATSSPAAMAPRAIRRSANSRRSRLAHLSG